MPKRAAVSGPPDFWVEFTLRNSCVSFFDDGFSRFRSVFLSPRERLEAVVHGFTEYTFGYQRLTGVRPPTPNEVAQKLPRCERGPPRVGRGGARHTS